MAEVIVPLVIGYLLPSFIAIVRGHDRWWEIVAFNLLLGWTILGWIFALVWSLTAPNWRSAMTVTERFHGDAEPQSARQRITQR
jgi:hypothetical protein